ncbi:MAG: inositol monophosphatase [Bacteroidales bacterium]|nr:inositol monophosphatase [Bacteroidales bacterium]MCB8999364.1 inositol monophosphatase [Bacteroidales bacterium]MCB9013393.1 inositol monophosphatase [Bacteroidales bacterium]
MNLEKLCADARTIVAETAGYITSELRKREGIDIEVKGKHNYVTHVDKTAEKMLVTGLSALLPDSGFIAEEGTSTHRGERYNWVIDPLDGTTNYIHGLPPFAISVALMDHEELVIGIVHEMALNECFYAWKGSKAFLNGKEIHVSKTGSVNDSLIATGFPYTDFSYMTSFMETVRFFMENSHGLRRLGSAATDIAYVACGRFDGFYEYGLNPWDVAAGVLIVKQAGGRVADFKGEKNYLFGGEIVISNDLIFDEFLEDIKTIMIR